MAITQNYVSSTNLSDVLRFLQHKPQQISGCRDRPEAIKPDRLLEAFVAALREHRPSLLAEAQECAKEGWRCDAWKDDNVTKSMIGGDSCSTCLESSRKKGKSVVDQAKLSHMIDNDDIESCNEMKKDGGFMFSFM